MKSGHLKDLEKYLSKTNKSVDGQGFNRKQQVACESRKQYELTRLGLVTKLRQFQQGKNLATARQLVCLSRALLPFDDVNSLQSLSSCDTSSKTKAGEIANKKMIGDKVKSLSMLSDLERLLDSGQIESAVYALDADWDDRSSQFTEALQVYRHIVLYYCYNIYLCI